MAIPSKLSNIRKFPVRHWKGNEISVQTSVLPHTTYLIIFVTREHASSEQKYSSLSNRTWHTSLNELSISKVSFMKPFSHRAYAMSLYRFKCDECDDVATRFLELVVSGRWKIMSQYGFESRHHFITLDLILFIQNMRILYRGVLIIREVQVGFANRLKMNHIQVEFGENF